MTEKRFSIAGRDGKTAVSSTSEVSKDPQLLLSFLQALYRHMLMAGTTSISHSEAVEIYDSLFCDKETGNPLSRKGVSGSVQKMSKYAGTSQRRDNVSRGFSSTKEKDRDRIYFFDPESYVVENTNINPAEIAISATVEILRQAQESQRKLIQEIRPRTLEAGEALRKAQAELKRLSGKAAEEDVGDRMQRVLERIERIKQGSDSGDSDYLSDLESWELALRSIRGTLKGELKKLNPENVPSDAPVSAEG